MALSQSFDKPVIPLSSENRGHQVGNRIRDIHQTHNDNTEVVWITTVDLCDGDVEKVNDTETDGRVGNGKCDWGISEEDEGVSRSDEVVVKEMGPFGVVHWRLAFCLD